jgi:hypothetical protein
VPTAVITAIHELPMTVGALRVVKGARIEHVVGDPGLGPEKDHAYGLRIVRGALATLQQSVEKPTLFDPTKMIATQA